MAKFQVVGTLFQRKAEDGTLQPAVKMSYGKDGKAIAKFTVAEARKFGKSDSNKLDFWEVTAFGKLGEFVEKNFQGGKPISVWGDEYHSSSESGKYLNIVASDVEFVPKDFTGDGTQPQQAPQQVAPQPAPQQAPPQTQQTQQYVQQTPQVQPQQYVQQAPQVQPQQYVQQAQPVAQQAPPQQVQQGGFAPPTPPAGFDPYS